MDEAGRAELRLLADFASRFATPGFSAGEWGGGEKAGPKSITMPYFELSHAAQEFVSACYSAGWVSPDVDWPTWAQGPTAAVYRADPSAVQSAPVEDLRALLTTIIRQERFSDGTIEGAFESGLIPRICERAQVILSEMNGEG